MAVIFALTKLFDDVVALMGTEAGAQVPPVTPPPNYFGWREPQRQGRADSGRIVWIPGDPSGNVGALGPAKYPGQRTDGRSLATLVELFTVEITATDAVGSDAAAVTAALDSERRQYLAARLLYDDWVRAVYLCAYGTFKIISQTWDTTHNQRRRGATIRVVCALEAKIPDSPITGITGVGAEVDEKLLEVTERVSVPVPEGEGATLTEEDGLGSVTEEDATTPITDEN